MEPSHDDDEIDLRNLLSHLIQRKWVILLSVAAAVAAALVYLKLATPVYEATATVEVPQQLIDVVKIEDVQNQDLRSEEILRTIEQNFQRRSLFLKVIQTPEVSALLPSTGNPKPPEQQAEDILEQTTIRLEKGTRLIRINVENTNPELAQKIANGIVREFLKEYTDKLNAERQAALVRLEAEMEKSRKQLQQSQSAFQQLENLSTVHEKITTRKATLSELKESYLDDHPDVKKARSALDDAYNELESLIAATKSSLNITDEAVTPDNATREQKLDAAYQQLISYQAENSVRLDENRTAHDSIIRRRTDIERRAGVNSVPVIEREAAWLPSDPVRPNKIQILAASVVLGSGFGIFIVWLLHFLDNTFRTVDETERLTGHSIFAAVPNDPRLPDSAWLQKSKNRKLSELITAYQESRKPVVKGGKIEPVILLSDPGSPAAESMRTLRASITILEKFKDKDISRILISSSNPGEGKSFVAANLAVALAGQEKQSTLLIDADLRRPTVASLFDLQKDSPKGLSDALISLNSGEPEITTIFSGIQNLDILPAGTSIATPAELLSSSSMVDLLDRLSKKYDRIVIDGAPVNTVSDSLLIAPLVSLAVFVVRANTTPRKSVLRACQALKDAGQDPAGLVLNAIHSKAGLASDPYFYHYAEGAEAYGENYK